jgi:DNA-binding response OmpR family regulator
MRVLLVEDEARAAQALAKGLREHAYAVDVARDGEAALYQAAITEFDAIVLDIALPLVDGVAVCRELRARGSLVPVLMLTARDAIEARIAGLDSGADDYLTKPYDFNELLARLRAVIRRGHRPIAPAILCIGTLELDSAAQRVTCDGRPVALTRREYGLLEFLVRQANTVVGRAAIAEHVWDSSYDPVSNVIDVCVQRLRRKLDEPGRASMIETRRGDGYMLVGTPIPAAKR